MSLDHHGDPDLDDDLRALLRDVQRVDVPEPSPLFWDHVVERVNAEIDRPGVPGRRWWRPAVLGWMGAAAAIVIVMVMLFRGGDRLVPQPVPGNVVSSGPREEMVLPDNVEQDEAWALVSGLAEELHYDDIEAAGIAARPGAVDRAAMEMSEDERAELVRLIQDEMKRTGA